MTSNEPATALPDVSFVSVDGGSNNPGINEQLDGEVMLDIEVIGAVVPKAKIVVYFAPNNGDQGFVDAISAAVHDTERKIDVISISWGGAEPDPSEVDLLQPYNDVFKAAAAVGITVCVASGDQGALGTAISGAGAQVHVDHPACDPYVLACGGTEIDPSDQDVAWNEGFDEYGVLWATGGGISQCYGVPSYQGNVNLPEALGGGSPGRGVPDIAMSATDYFVRVDTAEVVSGGTSAVAPLMASLVTRLNQAKQKSVGFLNPFLYANAAAGVVSDVTAGSNGVAGQAPGYDARPGWDPCTGLGTPNGAAILNAL